jgi:nucleoside phosphorylase
LRDDHVLDDVLPVEIPIPPIAEVQQALFHAAERVSGESGEELKQRLRTGTVVTTDDRNWELRYTLSALRFNQSRAVAIDMESATIAAQGYRFRVPYGTLLCVSDTARSSCRAKPTASTSAPSRSICGSGWRRSSCCVRRAASCTRASSGASTSRRSGKRRLSSS